MNTSRINRVSIKKLWGVKNISTTFDKHVNIFIGANGSSKTTFLNLIEATLLCDISTLACIEFETIEIELLSDHVTIIKLSKIINDDMPTIKYFFNKAEYEIPCNEMIYRPYRSYHLKYNESYLYIKQELSKLINISWLSINRDNTSSFEYDRTRDSVERIKNMVDIKLQELLKKLIVYQLQLESEANKSANKFKEDSLSLMLYDESVDVYKKDNLMQIMMTDADLMKKDLYKAYSVLGVAKDKNKQIQTHIAKIKEVISKIQEKREIDINDVYILSLINRTLSIIEISKTHECQIQEIFEPMNKFWKCLKKFMPNKTFVFDKENDGNINIILKEGDFQDVPINITSLSSGEKQLFILLTEALLQRGSSHLFIADEPELSLHIEWQRKILNALLDLNPNAQIIVATHSPEIAGNFAENIINMKKITSYE